MENLVVFQSLSGPKMEDEYLTDLRMVELISVSWLRYP